MKSVTIPYRQENHGDFDAEWPVQMKLSDPEIYVTEDTVNYQSLAHLKREATRMLLTVKTELFDLNLRLDKGKGATWHADDGVLPGVLVGW
jgi:hypothetical protein